MGEYFSPLLLGCDKQEARGCHKKWESEIAVLYANTRKPQWWAASKKEPAAVLSPKNKQLQQTSIPQEKTEQSCRTTQHVPASFSSDSAI